MTRVLVVTGALLLATGLAGCGKVGRLERPGPMFGAHRGTVPDAEGPGRRQDPSRPVDTVDPRDRSSDPTPPALRIPGTDPEPIGVAPPAALPAPPAAPR